MKHRAHRSLRTPELACAQLLQFFGTTLEHLAASTLESSLLRSCIPETSGACSRPNLSEVVRLCVHGSLSTGTQRHAAWPRASPSAVSRAWPAPRKPLPPAAPRQRHQRHAGGQGDSADSSAATHATRRAPRAWSHCDYGPVRTRPATLKLMRQGQESPKPTEREHKEINPGWIKVRMACYNS